MAGEDKTDVAQQAGGMGNADLEKRQALFLRVLQVRFGELPEQIAQRVQAGNRDNLDTWAERLLLAGSIGMVFEENKAAPDEP